MEKSFYFIALKMTFTATSRLGKIFRKNNMYFFIKNYNDLFLLIFHNMYRL